MSRPRERIQFISAKENPIGVDLFLFGRGKEWKYFFDADGNVYGMDFQRSERLSEAARQNNQERFQFLMEKQG